MMMPQGASFNRPPPPPPSRHDVQNVVQQDAKPNILDMSYEEYVESFEKMKKSVVLAETAPEQDP